MTTLYIIIFAIVLGAVACIWAAAMSKTIPGYRAAPETYDLYQRINQELITAAQSPKIIYHSARRLAHIQAPLRRKRNDL